MLALVFGNPSGKSNNPTQTTSAGQSAAPLPGISVSGPPDNPAAAAPCTQLIAALPIDLSGLQSRPALSTASSFVVAWGEPAIVLRCGVDRPKGLVPGSDKFTTGIDNVFYWVDTQKKQTVYTVIDRPVYVEVAVPDAYQGDKLAPISEAVQKALKPVCVVNGAADPATQCTHRP